MADPFLAEIRILPCNFAPTGWAFCDGQTMAISQNTALFALLGTTYGGSGISFFALPDLRGAAPMHPGNGPGLSPHVLGESGGEAAVSLLEGQIPAHIHSLQANPAPGTRSAPGGHALARTVGARLYQNSLAGLTPLSDTALTSAGGGQPHDNMQPYLTLNFCIALEGIFPQRW